MVAPNPIENASGGRGVVPANFVVASLRADFPLTRAGLVAAIAALPAGGGEIYIGDGTLSITSTITINKHVKLIGSGRSTILSVANGVTAFDVGDFAFEVVDLRVSCNNSAGSKFINYTATSDFFTTLINVQVGTSLFGIATNTVETLFDMNTLGRNFRFVACNMLAGGADPQFLRDGTGGTMYVESCEIKGNIPTAGPIMYVSDSKFAATGNVVYTAGSQFANSSFQIDGSITFGSQSNFASCTIIAGTTMTAGQLCSFSACVLSSAMTAGGSFIRLNGCSVTSFTSSSQNGHVIVGNYISGAGNNITLTDSSNCIVADNYGAQVNETGTSDGNQYDDNQLFSGSTIIGPTSTVNGARKSSKSSSSTNALVTVVPTITNPNGLQGIGRIKNTDGANSIDVKESYTDAFGVTSTKTTTVAPGNYLELNLDMNIAGGTEGFPPYVSYKVEVIDTVAGNHATYVAHFTSQGVV